MKKKILYYSFLYFLLANQNIQRHIGVVYKTKQKCTQISVAFCGSKILRLSILLKDILKTFFSSHISSYVQPKTILLQYTIQPFESFAYVWVTKTQNQRRIACNTNKHIELEYLLSHFHVRFLK